MASLRQSRPGVSLLEVVIAVAMSSMLILATVWEMRQLLWVARQNHQALVADSLAWDVVWRAYNAQGWSMPAAMTNGELTVGYDSQGYRLAGASALARAVDGGADSASRVSLAVGDVTPLRAGGRRLRSLAAEVRWYDDVPVWSDTAVAEHWHVRRVGLYKPAFERSWTRVEEDVLSSDDKAGGRK